MNLSAGANLQNDIVRVISREEMAALPIRRYEGEVCLSRTPLNSSARERTCCRNR